MFVVLRPGPFINAEWRNGAIPDWTMTNKGFQARSNHPEYLEYVRLWYKNLGSQIKRYYHSKDNPIILTQLENEFMHARIECPRFAGAPQFVPVGSGGIKHLKYLRQFALEAGIKGPFSVTGWGIHYRPELHGFLSTPGFYPLNSWDVNKFLPFGMSDEWGRLKKKYPLLAIEQQAGMGSRYRYCPVVPTSLIECFVVARIASGFNGISYYTFCGGTNPTSNRNYYFNDPAMVHKSYDWQAPIGEYGQVRERYKVCKLLGLFLNEFGSSLSQMKVVGKKRF